MRTVRLVTEKAADVPAVLKEAFSYLSSDDGIFVREFTEGEGKVSVYIGEDFYFRTNSTLMITVVVKEEPNKITVDIVSGGGKTGLLGFSWGAEDSAVKKMVKLLKNRGFDLCENP